MGMYQVVTDWMGKKIEGHWLSEVEYDISLSTGYIDNVKFNFTKVTSSDRVSGITVKIKPQINYIDSVEYFKGASKAYTGVAKKLDELELQALYEDSLEAAHEEYIKDKQTRDVAHIYKNSIVLRVYF
jgi:hypothetical protein